ncbi:MAG: hypothetical protein LBH07_07760 [Treponema sp.]|jgi:hypothetical protein|nr:hypothetical protein [Treponema sp.]
MDELFNNILYLIPIALFVALRIANTKNKQDKKQQQKKTSGELIRKIREAQNNPDFGKALPKSPVEVFFPPREAGQKPVVGKKAIKKKPVVIPPVPKPSFYNEVSADSAIFGQVMTKTNESAVQAAASDVMQPFQTGISGLTPLQQALVWSEILGLPKGVSAI